MTTTYPIKPSLYAITKSTNYLPNVLMQMEAKEAGYDNGVFIDENGHVGEGLQHECGVRDERRRARPPEVRPRSQRCTSLRLLELARLLQGQELLHGVEVRDITVADALASREMLLLGSSVKVARPCRNS